MMFPERRKPWRLSSRLWPFRGQDEEIVTIVDLGARKVVCAILALQPSRFNGDRREFKVLGQAIVRSAGFSGGRIGNMAAVETCLRRAVGRAESEAGITAEDVYITGQFSGMSAELFEARLPTKQDCLLPPDIEAVISAAESHCASLRRELLHVFGGAAPAEGHDSGTFRNAGYAREVSAVSMPLRGAHQLAACLKQSLLNPLGIVAGPVAAALAVTSAEERHKGVLVLDMGAQSTGCAFFQGDMPVFLEIVPQGGDHITDDIAKTFSLRKFEAERLKIKHGSVFDGLQVDVDLPFANGETGEPISKFALNQLVRARVSAIFRAINERLKGAGYSALNCEVALTGGGSMLPGIQDLASQVLIAEVRLRRAAFPSVFRTDGGLSALAGGCLYVCRHHSPDEFEVSSGSMSRSISYASRISQWLRASF